MGKRVEKEPTPAEYEAHLLEHCEAMRAGAYSNRGGSVWITAGGYFVVGNFETGLEHEAIMYSAGLPSQSFSGPHGARLGIAFGEMAVDIHHEYTTPEQAAAIALLLQQYKGAVAWECRRGIGARMYSCVIASGDTQELREHLEEISSH